MLPTPAKASRVLAFLFLGALLTACAVPPAPGGDLAQALASPYQARTLPGQDGAVLHAIERGPLTPPVRYRVVALPGSGCAGMGAIAQRYFAGLLHAQVLVLHKRFVHPLATTSPGQCSNAFVQADALSVWQADAQAALNAWQAQQTLALPTVLVGISEGGELLAHLAPQVHHLAGVVLLSASGLNPREAGQLQAQRLGVLPAWQALEQAQAGSAPDSDVHQGRSLRYWRDLWRWELAQPLIDGPWALAQVWGQADALVPPAAYTHFAQRAQQRRAPWCQHPIAGADHGLQRPGHDGVQQLWAWLEQWARAPQQGLCAPWQR